MINFATDRLLSVTTFWKIRSVMLILFVENVGNFQNDARDSIVVLTRIAWAAIVTSASKVSYDHQQRRGIVGSRFFIVT